jgi:hypothetical protein
MTKLTPSSIVEVPANWHLDDWPPMQPKMPAASGFVDTQYDSFVFPISTHPQVSGKPQVILMHERLIEYINSHEGVEWCTFEKMVKLFKDGEFGGVTIEGA